MGLDLGNPRLRDAVGIAIVVVSSLCIAFVPSSAKLALDDGASLIALLMSRCLIGAILLLPVTLYRQGMITIPARYLPRILMVTVFNIGMIACMYSAVEYIDIGLATLILYIFPLGIALLSHLTGKERINFRQWVAIACLLAGLCFLMMDTVQIGSKYGLILSFASMVFAMLFIMNASTLTSELGAAVINLHANLWSVVYFIVALILIPGLDFLYPVTADGWFAIISNGVFYMLGYWLFFEGCRFVGVTRASLLTLVDPLFAALMAIVFLGQMLNVMEWFGFAVILISLITFELKRDHKEG